MTPDKRRPRPGGNGRGPLDFIAVDNSDGSEDSLEVDLDPLRPRAVHPDELPELRALWWRQAALGRRLPPETGVILIRGGE